MSVKNGDERQFDPNSTVVSPPLCFISVKGELLGFLHPVVAGRGCSLFLEYFRFTGSIKSSCDEKLFIHL